MLKYLGVSVRLTDVIGIEYFCNEDNGMKETNKNLNTWMCMGMCFGVAIGTSLGTVFDNIALGTGLGISIGLAVGVAIGSSKDKAVNDQVKEKGYTVKEILPKGDNEYTIVIIDNSGTEKEVIIPSGIMDTELFSVGDVVFMDEDGMIEQVFDKEDE